MEICLSYSLKLNSNCEKQPIALNTLYIKKWKYVCLIL